MRYPTQSIVAASPVTITGVPERRVRIHKVSAPGALTITDVANANVIWGPGQANEDFNEPLRSEKAGSDVSIVSGTAGTVSVQFSYEGA